MTPEHAGTPGRQHPRCRTPSTAPCPTSRACHHGRHHIPLRHALLPRSKSRKRQQRKEQDRGSNYPGAGRQGHTHGHHAHHELISHPPNLLLHPPALSQAPLTPHQRLLLVAGGTGDPLTLKPQGSCPQVPHQSLIPGPSNQFLHPSSHFQAYPHNPCFQPAARGSDHSTPGLKTTQ